MKQKTPPKSKEQIAHEMKLKQEAEKGKAIVKDILFPILFEHATTISNAERITEVFKVIIMQAMQMPFKDKTIGDLDFKPMLDEEKDDKSKETFIAFVEGFRDVKIADAVKILQEFEGGVNAYFNNESRKREFKTLTLEDLIGK
jgi:predicted metal-dependent peptidase